MSARANLRVTKLVHGTGLDAPAELRGHRLHAVTNAEHWYTKLKDGRRCGRCIGCGHRFGSARENDAFRSELADRRVTCIPRMDLAVDAELAHTTRNQLRVLRTEIEDEDSVSVYVGHEMR